MNHIFRIFCGVAAFAFYLLMLGTAGSVQLDQISFPLGLAVGILWSLLFLLFTRLATKKPLCGGNRHNGR